MRKEDEEINDLENEDQRHRDRNMTILRGKRIWGEIEETYIPVLHLTGLWMWRAGFSSGDKVRITVHPGFLKIWRTKCRE